MGQNRGSTGMVDEKLITEFMLGLAPTSFGWVTMFLFPVNSSPGKMHELRSILMKAFLTGNNPVDLRSLNPKMLNSKLTSCISGAKPVGGRSSFYPLCIKLNPNRISPASVPDTPKESLYHLGLAA